MQTGRDSAPAGPAGSTGSTGSAGSAGSAGSLLSIGSSGSILSIGSAGSILSIGSAGSILSIGSAGSVASAFSVGSAASLGTVLSGFSYLSILAWRSGTGEPAASGQERPAAVSGQAVFLITGIPAAGKSTVAQLLAERLPLSVHVRGDLFRRMVVSGRADMTPEPGEEALRQLRLRHELAAAVSDGYFRAGFTVLGEYLAGTIAALRSRPLLVIVLAPRPRAVAARSAARAAIRRKTAYGEWAVSQLDHVLREQTPHLGLWLDTSAQTPAETVDEILARAWGEARIGDPVT
jgi:cytidylate kinase